MGHTLLLLAFAFLSEPRVSIHVLPQAFIAGSSVRLTCTVSHHPDNRWLTLAIIPETSSTKQLDGESAPITHVLLVHHVSCDADIALCEVEDNLGHAFSATAPLQVGGCHPEGDPH